MQDPVNHYKHLKDKAIIEKIGMADLPLIIYHLYKKYKGKYQLINIGNDCMFQFGKTNVGNVSYLATYIHFVTIENHILKIEGNVSWPSVLKEHFEFFVSVNGQKNKCSMFDAGLDLNIGCESYETRTAFIFEKLLNDNESYDISFFYYCNGIPCQSGKINSMRFSPVADVLENQYAVRNGWIIQIKNNRFTLKRQNQFDKESLETRYIESITNKLGREEAKHIIALRNEYFRRIKEKSRQIWLFLDRIDKADDNGEAMFEYISRLNQNHADCYFIISEDSPDYKKMKSIGRVINALSDEHCLMLLMSDYIFTSQLNGWVENPFGMYEECFRDIYHQAKVIFLQHGVTKDNQSGWLNRYNQNLYAIVSNSEKEKEAFLEYPYFYQENQIWNTGMPRFDKLYRDDRKYILFMPTWRKRLMEQKLDPETGIYKWYLKDGFEKSRYYKYYHKVLNNRFFLKYCKKAGYQAVFMPHPIMQPYLDKFQVSDQVVIMPYGTQWRDLFAQSSIMITDYSSVAFDFAYLKKPVLYFQFDRRGFFKSHTYRSGYFDYKKMGFGKVVKTRLKLYITIFGYIKKGCLMKPEYEKRVENFYTNFDSKRCERIYSKVVMEDDEL